MPEVHIEFDWGEFEVIQRILKENVQRDLIAEVGDVGVLLYQFYLRRSTKNNYTFPDEDAAKYFGWDIKKVARTRRKLMKAHWFHQRSGKYSNGTKIFTTYLGKKEVLTALGIRDVDIWEKNAIGQRACDELGLTLDEAIKNKDAKKLAEKYLKEAEHTPIKASIQKDQFEK